jgi:RNA ligase
MFTLDEAREAIKNKPEFSCNKREFGWVIDYNVAFKESFTGATERETLILQNLRGTCFDEFGRITRLAYHKFHNLNENELYAEANYDFSSKHRVEEKLDGSMIAPVQMQSDSKYRWLFGTRAGVTEVAAKAQKLYENWLTEDYSKFTDYLHFINACLDRDMTPIFEFCSREQRIVIDYDEPKLVLTAIRSNRTGAYLDLEPLKEVYESIDFVQTVTTSHMSLSQFAKSVKEVRGVEGVVVKFADGRFVKIKGDDYCLKHRALDGLRFEKDVLALVLKNELDDVLPLVTPEVRERLEKYRDSVQHRIQLAKEELDGIWTRLSFVPTKREFAELVKDSIYKTALFKLYDGKTYSFEDFVLSKCGSSTDVESVRWLIGTSYYEI